MVTECSILAVPYIFDITILCGTVHNSPPKFFKVKKFFAYEPFGNMSLRNPILAKMFTYSWQRGQNQFFINYYSNRDSDKIN